MTNLCQICLNYLTKIILCRPPGAIFVFLLNPVMFWPNCGFPGVSSRLCTQFLTRNPNLRSKTFKSCRKTLKHRFQVFFNVFYVLTRSGGYIPIFNRDVGLFNCFQSGVTVRRWDSCPPEVGRTVHLSRGPRLADLENNRPEAAWTTRPKKGYIIHTVR